MTPVRLWRKAKMSIVVILTSEVTAIVEPVETSHWMKLANSVHKLLSTIPSTYSDVLEPSEGRDNESN